MADMKYPGLMRRGARWYLYVKVAGRSALGAGPAALLGGAWHVRPSGGDPPSDPFQKWFTRFLAETGATAPRTSYHSFRHSFRDALREAQASDEIVDALLGWTRRTMRETYGSGPRIAALAEAVAQVRFDAFDLVISTRGDRIILAYTPFSASKAAPPSRRFITVRAPDADLAH
jgi:hypothetical protein